ncbi:uncharacterized protein TRAVEDRAFT_16100 [Trametes versicolor FP-101664 SS1]|uniref:uncharacterized protein n=1 Tax=Trametes versicolor (strain FP-101664) TaxID=717944 RepID=UPI00046214E4|nr:uncharacterized protein TRAVEDRAFT_16100 [Trametes versicolor FP-101664 SS1]EIW63816.1 hypothetical protein TRAVEDRAFT_16100 [Trametes versicolor FP-101664 SS1]
MSTTLAFPSDIIAFLDKSVPWDKPSFVSLSLQPALQDTGVDVDVQYTLKDQRRIAEHSEYEMFRAHLLKNDEVLSKDTLKVVCKSATRSWGPELFDALSKEAALYQGRLLKLQGVYVPKLIGFFEGAGPKGDIIRCLVLEHVGQGSEAPQRWSSNLSDLEIRKQMLQAMVAIHQAGVEHGGWHGSPYTVKGDKIYIIGFSEGKEHTCRVREGVDLRLGMIEPLTSDVLCLEMFQVAAATHAWIDRGWRYMDMIVGVDTIIEGGVEALVALADGEPDARRKAEELCDLVKRRFADGGCDDMEGELAKFRVREELLRIRLEELERTETFMTEEDDTDYREEPAADGDSDSDEWR